MARKTAFVYADELSRHTLSETHPMKPARLRYTYELLQAYNAFDAPNVSVVAPREALLEEIQWYHSADYVDAVQRLNNGDVSVDQRRFNFGPGDNPAYRGIYDASALSTGATMTAVEMLLSDEVDAAFSISGGLHHAMPSYAYGFCVFNDPVIGIKRLLAEGLRVAYVDIDCHHGDGVQHAFYDTDAVMTISLHESGAFLFPGTGHTQEIGAGRGRGYSVNMPLYPYTTDEVYLWALREVAMPLLHRFQPDVLVTQLGIDSHFRDPITHLALSVQGHAAAVQELASLGARKWLALGGGGSDLQAVGRAWAMDFAVTSEQ
ncbi:MAG: acetoin utilization protein AcuC, partial [Chloroflexi bacterium]|nr:acetoin utilization protein AcuC [Chloroflexota bacterium]